MDGGDDYVNDGTNGGNDSTTWNTDDNVDHQYLHIWDADVADNPVDNNYDVTPAPLPPTSTDDTAAADTSCPTDHDDALIKR